MAAASKIGVLNEAVTAALNAHTGWSNLQIGTGLGPSPTATEAVFGAFFYDDRKRINNLKVVCESDLYKRRAQARNKKQYEFIIQVTIARDIEIDDVDNYDPLYVLAEEAADVIEDTEIGDYEYVELNDEDDQVYVDPAYLANGVFLGTLRFRYRLGERIT